MVPAPVKIMSDSARRYCTSFLAGIPVIHFLFLLRKTDLLSADMATLALIKGLFNFALCRKPLFRSMQRWSFRFLTLYPALRSFSKPFCDGSSEPMMILLKSYFFSSSTHAPVLPFLLHGSNVM